MRSPSSVSQPSSLSNAMPLAAVNLSVSTSSSAHSNQGLNAAASSSCSPDINSFKNSLVEIAVNELNSKIIKSHRRMCSVPNIQINIAKRNSMAVAAAKNRSSNNDDPSNQSFCSNQSFANNLSGAELKIGMNNSEEFYSLMPDSSFPSGKHFKVESRHDFNHFGLILIFFFHILFEYN